MLLTSQLHGSLADPVIDSMNFLNEIIDRFPEAISFAPGAPNPAQLRDIDVNQYVDRYLEYLCHDRGFKIEQARRLLYQYGPARGIINDLIATSLLQDKGIKVPPEALVVTVGAQEAMLIVLRVLFRSSHEQLAVVTPCFVGILGAARLLEIDIIGIDETEQGIALDELDKACHIARESDRPIRALYVAPDYSNPSGTVLDLFTRQRLLELAEQHDFFILEDNAYGFTAPPGEALPTLKTLDETARVIFIGTFAKICLPGARVGYVIADQWIQGPHGSSSRLATAISAVKSMVTVNTSPICQALIAGILLEEGGSIAKLESKKSELYRNNLALLVDRLEHRLSRNKMPLIGVSWNRPVGGFFVRVRLPVPVNVALLEFSALNYGVLWTPMSSFYLNNAGDNEQE